MKKQLSAGVVIFFFLFLALNSASGHSEKTTASVVTVTITDQGFDPDYVAIEKGTTVTWVSSGVKEHWPASNFHPIHTEYPDSGIEKCGTKEASYILDACRGLLNGESYSFTFDKVGQWGMHDHLYPLNKMMIVVWDATELAPPPEGTITISFVKSLTRTVLTFLGFKQVEGKKQTAQLSLEKRAEEAKENCENPKNLAKGGIFGCYAKEMEDISFKQGREAANEVLSAIQKTDLRAKGCHFIAHGIGWGSYKRNPSDWQNLIAESSSRCSYGEQMGIIESYTQSLPEGKLKKENVPTLCGEKPRADCNHAVGHMMLLEAKNDLKKAIDLCSGIKNEKQRYMCFTGMFMERIIASNLIEHNVAPLSYKNWTGERRIKENETLCRSLKGVFANACWREMAHPAFYYFGKDPQKIFDFCNTAETKEAGRECATHALAELAGSLGYDFSKMRTLCTLERSIDSAFEKSCYLALVSMKIQSVSGEEASDAPNFCRSLPSEWQSECLKRVEIDKKAKSVGRGWKDSIVAD